MGERGGDREEIWKIWKTETGVCVRMKCDENINIPSNLAM